MSQCKKYYINKFDKYFTKNTMSTVSRNFQNEKVRYKMNRYILHTVFLQLEEFDCCTKIYFKKIASYLNVRISHLLEVSEYMVCNKDWGPVKLGR